MKTFRVAIALALALVAIAAAIRAGAPREHELLREVYTPHFASVPPRPPAGDTMEKAWHDLRSPQGQAFLQRWLPSQGGTLWIALLVLVAAGFDLERLRHPRNVDLAAMFLLGVLFFDILVFTRRLPQPYWLAVAWWVFDAVVAVSLFVAVRAVWRVVRPFRRDWRPAVRGRGLVAIALLMVGLDLAAGLIREPDDSGYFVNLGAQRLRERGLLPYGDPLLTGTPGAAYGPLLYVAQVPFQWLVDPEPVNPVSTPRPPLGADSTYRLPSPLAAQLCSVAFQLLATASLFAAGRRFGSRETGWGLVALYAGSAFVLGMGGDDYFIGGMTYISHIGPPAVTLAAFAALHRPALAGTLLVAATGCGFYPAFLFPAWAGHYWGRRRDLTRFALAVAVSGALLAAFVLLFSRPAAGRGLIGTILWDTFGHHSDPAGYGRSPFGFWGQRPGFHGALIQPLAGSSGLTSPVMLVFFAFAASCFFLARRRAAQALALLSAAIVIGATLVKIHATGTYVTWFYPLLLLGLLLPADGRAADRSATIEDSACRNGPAPQP